MFTVARQAGLAQGIRAVNLRWRKLKYYSTLSQHCRLSLPLDFQLVSLGIVLNYAYRVFDKSDIIPKSVFLQYINIGIKICYGLVIKVNSLKGQEVTQVPNLCFCFFAVVYQ